MQNELTASEIRPIIEYVIDNNLKLAAQNEMPKALCITGEGGIGKTMLLKKICNDNNTHHFIRINPAEMVVDDVIGFPIVQFEMYNTESKVYTWVTKELLEKFTDIGYRPTAKTQMSYAIPQWLHGNALKKPVLLLIDDFTRGSSLMMQALMTIIDEQSYISWALPKGSSVILSSNPSDGEYFVTEIDKSQKGRYIELNMKASVADWAAWATGIIPDKFIDFLQKHTEIIEKNDETGTASKGSLRDWTRYFQTIQSISSLETNWYKLALPLGGSLPEAHLLLLHKFLQEKLDELPTSVEILNSKEPFEMLKHLTKITKNRKDITALITKRLYNHVIKFSDTLKPVEIQNYILLLEDENLLTQDLNFIYIRNLAQPKYNDIFKVTTNPKLIDKILG